VLRHCYSCKKGPKKDPGSGKLCRTLELSEPLLRWAKGKTVFFAQELDRVSSLAQWADVAELYAGRDAAFGIGFVFHPAERKPLRPANVRAFRVDAARAVVIEKGTGADGMRHSDREEGAVVDPNFVGLDLENRKIVHATRAAASPTAEAIAVKKKQSSCDGVDVGVKRHDAVTTFGACGEIGLRAVGQAP
jgi:hypothetical protein